MVRDTSPWTCLRAGQSRVANTQVAPGLCGTNISVQIRDDPLGIRLKPAKTQSCAEMVTVDSDTGTTAHL